MNVYRWFYWVACVVAVLTIPVILGFGSAGSMAFVWSSIAGMAVLAVLSIGFTRHWNALPTGPAMWAGAAFIAGGAVFDVYATLRHSPDLTDEANPFARAMLDNDVELRWVLLAGFVAQAALVAAAVMLWANFIARLDWYKQAIRDAEGMRMVGRIFGASDNRWLSLLGGRVRHDVFASSMGFVVIGVFAHRWYLGLEWFGLVPISRIVVPACILLSTIAVPTIWGRGVASSDGGIA